MLKKYIEVVMNFILNIKVDSYLFHFIYPIYKYNKKYSK